jgi:hypothetical protein
LPEIFSSNKFHFRNKPDKRVGERMLIFDGLAEHYRPDVMQDGWPGPNFETISNLFFSNPLLDSISENFSY